MKVIHKDIKKGVVKVGVKNLDDLWYLSHIIDENDLVRGKTHRKIKVGDSAKGGKTITKTITLTIRVEKVEFHKYSNILRVSGKIEEGTDDIAKGSYHTINVEPSVIITIIKQRWLKYQLDKLKEAVKEKAMKILICVLDREEACFAQMKRYGYEMMGEIKGDVQKKDDLEKKKKPSFYAEIIKQIKDYDERMKLNTIVIASASFWKEYLAKELKEDKIKKKIIFATCSSSGKNGIEEVLKRPEIISAIKDDMIIKEVNLVEDLFKEISTNEKAAYGIKEVAKATELGAVKELLVTDFLIQKTREDGSYYKLDKIMKTVDDMKGKVHIISSEHEGGQRLNGLGGIGAVLRYCI